MSLNITTFALKRVTMSLQRTFMSVVALLLIALQAQQFPSLGASSPPIKRPSPVALGHAIEDGNVTRFSQLLQNGASANAVYEGGMIPGPVLLVAAWKGSLPIVKLLIKHCADVNAVSQWGGQSPLMGAAYAKNLEMITLLLQHGANVIYGGRYSAFRYAAQSADIMQILLDHGASIETSDLDYNLARATGANAPAAVRWLLKHGANPNARDNFMKCSSGMSRQEIEAYRGPTMLTIALYNQKRYTGKTGGGDAREIIRMLRFVGAHE